jgi:hypothetical protein
VHLPRARRSSSRPRHDVRGPRSAEPVSGVDIKLKVETQDAYDTTAAETPLIIPYLDDGLTATTSSAKGVLPTATAQVCLGKASLAST